MAEVDSLLQGAAAACGSRRCEDAIALLEQALRLQPVNWGLCYRLGLCHGGGCRRHALTDQDVAIAYLRRALELIGASGEPAARAAVLDGLGDTYLHGTATPATARLEAAIECYEAVSAIHQSQGELSEWALAEDNLGNAWLSLPFADEKAGERSARRALRHFEHALRVRTRSGHPAGCAITQYNRGVAFVRLAATDGEARMRADACFREAHDCFLACGQNGHAEMARAGAGRARDHGILPT